MTKLKQLVSDFNVHDYQILTPDVVKALDNKALLLKGVVYIGTGLIPSLKLELINESNEKFVLFLKMTDSKSLNLLINYLGEDEKTWVNGNNSFVVCTVCQVIENEQLVESVGIKTCWRGSDKEQLVKAITTPDEIDF